MTEAQHKNIIIPLKKPESNWAQYLDFTLFIESGEIGNDDLNKFKNDFNQ